MLRAWTAPDAGQEALRREYVGFVEERGASALERDGGPHHLTASTFVLTRKLDHVLLAFHRKAQLWLQMGGHIEPGDPSVADAAAREAREESGLATVALWPGGLADLDRHVLVGSFGRCHTHWDLGFVALAGRGEPIAVSDESERVAWFPVDALPEATSPDLPGRLAHVSAAVRAGSSGSVRQG
ncbi:NUDIX hydrolase [Serinibacter arcticus]|uniref:NUDIX hydrolase n=1 Tax=Serinibacter arcticus TaxID=1655435 RepID=A0A2U1ZZ35_9MICO|nr:NUDIX hydrolase [Serinibacter arcticus]